MYYKFFDKQTSCDLHSGYNSESLVELADAYKSYKSIDFDEEDVTYYNSLSVEDILSWAKEDDFIIEESETKYLEYE